MAKYNVTDTQLEAIADKIGEKAGSAGIKLVGTTWVFNNALKMANEYGMNYNGNRVVCSENGHNVTFFTVNGVNKNGIGIGFSTVNGVPNLYYGAENYSDAAYSDENEWANEANKTITFTKEPTASRTEFLAWLVANATCTSVSTERLEMEFPDGFISMANDIRTLSETSDATATAADIVSGKTAYVNKKKLTGEYAPKVTDVTTKTTYFQSFTITSKYYNADEQVSRVVIPGNCLLKNSGAVAEVTASGSVISNLAATVETETIDSVEYIRAAVITNASGQRKQFGGNYSLRIKSLTDSYEVTIV